MCTTTSTQPHLREGDLHVRGSCHTINLGEDTNRHDGRLGFIFIDGDASIDDSQPLITQERKIVAGPQYNGFPVRQPSGHFRYGIPTRRAMPAGDGDLQISESAIRLLVTMHLELYVPVLTAKMSRGAVTAVLGARPGLRRVM